MEDVDLVAGLIHVQRGWHQYEGEQRPKSRAGERRVPIAAVLRPHIAGTLEARRSGSSSGAPQSFRSRPGTLKKRADRHRRAFDLVSVTFHECRHTFASLMIAAGVNAKALQTIMGHASITVTLDLYGHLLPGAEEEAAELLDRFLESGAVGKFGEAFGPFERLRPVLSGSHRLETAPPNYVICRSFRGLSGGGGIRTHGSGGPGSAVFKTAAFDHSATPPDG